MSATAIAAMPDVADWLKELLASGPLLAGEVKEAALLDGVPVHLVHTAATTVVAKEGSGSAMWWQLADAPKLGEGERRCTKCRAVKPLAAFGFVHGIPAEHSCLVCQRVRKRASERALRAPESVPGVNRAVSAAPDPAPAIRLREELQRQRVAGRPWRAAWPVAQRVALGELPWREQVEWRQVFTGTREQWHASYSGFTLKRSSIFLVDEHAA